MLRTLDGAPHLLAGLGEPHEEVVHAGRLRRVDRTVSRVHDWWWMNHDRVCVYIETPVLFWRTAAAPAA